MGLQKKIAPEPIGEKKYAPESQIILPENVPGLYHRHRVQRGKSEPQFSPRGSVDMARPQLPEL
jgi:hypothetical protein